MTGAQAARLRSGGMRYHQRISCSTLCQKPSPYWTASQAQTAAQMTQSKAHAVQLGST